mgnify:CR=1 FL=1
MLKILTYPNPVLRKKAEEVKEIDQDLIDLARQMAETMYAAPGIGLAAPQVGSSIRLIVVDVGYTQGRPDLKVLLNPEIVEREGSILMEEGCLSIPGIRADVERSQRVLVRGLDIKGRPVEIEAEGLLAVCLQHEVDHLDGILFIDHLSRLKGSLIERKLRKRQRE